MSGIINRTAFVDNDLGYPIYHDYCLVQTSLGICVEFQPPFQRDGVGVSHNTPFNPADSASKVNEVVSLSRNQRPAIFAGAGRLLHETSEYTEY